MQNRKLIKEITKTPPKLISAEENEDAIDYEQAIKCKINKNILNK